MKLFGKYEGRAVLILWELLCWYSPMYADDTVLVSKHKEADKATDISNTILGEIQEWCALNKIKLNRNKTKHMLVGKQKTDVTTKEIENIAMVEKFVYLGVTIDKNLNFEKNLDSTISRVNGRLISLARIRKMIDEHIRVCWYINRPYSLYWIMYQYWSILVRSGKLLSYNHCRIGQCVLWKGLLDISVLKIWWNIMPNYILNC